MVTVDQAGQSPLADLRTRDAARVDACWPHLHVELVQVTSDAAGERARAFVQLGGLTPADVRVELVRTRSGATPAPATHEEHRMFSSHALGNGGFVFEAGLPDHDASKPEEWLIRVHPSETLEEPRVEYRFGVNRDTLTVAQGPPLRLSRSQRAVG